MNKVFFSPIGSVSMTKCVAVFSQQFVSKNTKFIDTKIRLYDDPLGVCRQSHSHKTL